MTDLDAGVGEERIAALNAFYTDLSGSLRVTLQGKPWNKFPPLEISIDPDRGFVVASFDKRGFPESFRLFGKDITLKDVVRFYEKDYTYHEATF